MNINKITQYYFLIMLFSPLLSYITFGNLGLHSSLYYFEFLTCIYGVFFILKKNSTIKLDSILVLFIFYIIYIIVWSFYNGYYEEKGIFNATNARNLSVLFILIISQNTTYSKDFINNSILIIKVTVIFAAITSLIQVFNFSFLDANPLWAQGEIGDTLMGDKYKDRRSSIFGYVDTNEVGLSFLPLVSILTGFLYFTNNKYYTLFLILGGITAFLSNTRYIMVGYLLILIQVIIVNKISFKNLLKYLLSAVFITLVLFFLLSYIGYDLNQWYDNRLLSEGSLKETSRYHAWLNFQRFFPENPLFGTGVHMTREIRIASNEAGSSQIHVGYLAHLVSYGVFGSLLLFGSWFLLLRKLYIRARLSKYYGSFFAFFVFIWANATLVKYSMFYYGLIFAFIFDKIYFDHYIISKAKNLKPEINNNATS